MLCARKTGEARHKKTSLWHLLSGKVQTSLLSYRSQKEFERYRRVPKFSDTQNFAVIYLKFKEAKPEGILSKTCKWNSKQ